MIDMSGRDLPVCCRALFFFARNPVVDSSVKRKDKTTVSEAIECYEESLLNHSSTRTCHVSPLPPATAFRGLRMK
jgi:hypothetical protein